MDDVAPPYGGAVNLSYQQTARRDVCRGLEGNSPQLRINFLLICEYLWWCSFLQVTLVTTLLSPVINAGRPCFIVTASLTFRVRPAFLITGF